jgi:hypothetical protein
VDGWRQARSGRVIPCISKPPGDFFAGIFPYRIRDFKNNAEFCNISLGMNAELFHIAPVSETTTNQLPTMKTYYTVTLTEYSPRHNARTEFQRSIIHKRDNLTDRGLLRILKRDGEVTGDCQISRVERACYQSR